ncbi:M13 family metallopeptidase [Marinicella litoralis]|uniref:Endothelin-converting enzyme n=1 Tax=Marinicella litoralis TaxID=644220 RepID=A0A4V3DH02_9GAMM|nr:M13-type metalloendopeptidase [Marinicella litoralis]TDR16281.1 endothelin-converting enzyme [Marinicella litoralis]
MNRTLLLTGLTIGLAACQPNQVKQEPIKPTISSGITLSDMDKSVRPQDDFYQHVNGKWLNEFEIPADKSNFGAFNKLGDESREHVQAIIEEVSKMDNEQGSSEQKIADIYKSFMDTAAIEAKGLTPIKNELMKIDQISNSNDLSEYMGYADIYGSSPLSMYVYIDQKKSDEHIVYVGQSGLGLPDRDYYFKADEKSQSIREKYQQHMTNMFTLAGIKDPVATTQTVYAIEKDLAEGQWDRIQNRDRDKTYNKMTFDEFTSKVPNINWDRWLTHTMIDKPENLVVTQPPYLDTLNQIFTKYSVDDWKKYYKWHLLSNASTHLNADFADENFSFYGTVLSGTTEQEPRWKRGVDLVNGLAGELVGKVYVKKHFPPEAKVRMVSMIEQLRDAYGSSIKELEWMGEETKVKALDKLNKFDPKIGYPDVWRDYSELNITGTHLIENIKEATRFFTHRNRSKIGQPIDRNEWGMNPQRVNAYYNPTKNEIVFPAAILQAPFFNLEADEAVNYGGIGAVIGHEMGHGFDDQGSKYDGDGNLKNWWTEADRSRFEELTNKLVKQFDAFTVVDGTHVKGEFTQGENIGDLSGLAIAYKAFKKNYTDNRIIDGYTPEQRFFLGWAQVWKRKYRDEELLRRIDTDPHSPSEFRTNGILRNLPEFYEAFNVKPGDGMYLPEEERVKIW